MGKTLHLKKSNVSEIKDARSAKKAAKAQRKATAKQKANMSATTSPTQAQKDAEAQAQAELKNAMMEAAQSMVNFKVLAPFATCLITIDQLEEAIAANYPEIYIWNNNQLYQHMQLIGGRHVRFKVEHLPAKFKDIEEHLRASESKVTEEMNFLPAGKIPGEYWDQIVEFFRQVSNTKSREVEAHAWILWSQEKGYYISIPKQVVSKASVGYTWDATSVPPGSIVVIDVHSHNTMGAFFSGTDNNDDKDKLYYTAVVGKLTANSYEWTMRFNLKETKFQAKLDDVFDLVKTVEIPAEWLDQVEIKTYAPTPTVGTSPFPVGPYIGGPKNMQPGSTPQNPANLDNKGKWTAQDSINGKGGAGNSNTPFPSTPSLWDDADGGHWLGMGSLDGVEDFYASLGRDSEKNDVRGGNKETLSGAGAMKEIAATLQDFRDETGDGQLERLDQQATEWLRQQGYDEQGEPLQEVRGEIIPDGGEEDEDLIDPNPQSAYYDEVLEKKGVKTANNYELVDALITDLEGCDEALLDIAKACYHLLTEDGQMKVQTQGF